VARHASATRVAVEISVDRAGRQLTLVVDDNGIGIPAVPQRRSGLANIEERAARWRRQQLGPAGALGRHASGVDSEPADRDGATMTTSVFLLDDHELVRAGLRTVLEAAGDLTVIGEAGSAGEALARIPACRPDVAILDVRLPDGEGVSVCRDIRSSMEPPPACLMLTSYSDDEALFGAIHGRRCRVHAQAGLERGAGAGGADRRGRRFR